MQKLQLSFALAISIGKRLLSNNTVDTYEPNLLDAHYQYGFHMVEIFCGLAQPRFDLISDCIKRSNNTELLEEGAIEKLFYYPIRFQRYLATGFLGMYDLYTLESVEKREDFRSRCRSFIHEELLVVNQEMLDQLISHDHHEINIAGLDKATVLVSLYSAALQLSSQNMSDSRLRFIQISPEAHLMSSLSLEGAQKLLNDTCDFDYLRGVALKLYMRTDKLMVDHYNRYYGFHAAQKIIQTLRNALNEKVNGLSLQDRCVSVIKSDLPTFWRKLPRLPVKVRIKYPELEIDPAKGFNFELYHFIRQYPCQSFEAKIFFQMYKGCHDKGNQYNAINSVFQNEDFLKISSEQRAQFECKIIPILKARHDNSIDHLAMIKNVLAVLKKFTTREFDAQFLQKLVCLNLNKRENVKMVRGFLRESSPITSEKTIITRPLFAMILRYKVRVREIKNMKLENDQGSSDSSKHRVS